MNEMIRAEATVPDSAKRLAGFVSGLRAASLPTAVTEKLLLNVADTLGVTVGARGMSHVERVIAATRQLDGRPRASVLGHGFRTSETEAALANGFMAHAYDFDDASKFVHPGCVVVPAVLALAEARDASGPDVVAAIAAGYEVAVRVGAAAGPAHRKRAFHPTGTCSVFGAAAGCARLLGLPPEGVASALGFAGSLASGITRYRMDGSANKHLHAGIAARNGVTAAILAEQDLDGSSDIFEGELGFLEIYADGGRPQWLTEGLGTDFLLLDTDIKPYPSCRQTHGAVDLALAIAAEEAPAPGDIQSIEVSVYTYAHQHWYSQNDVPDSWLEALLRIPYCVAACLRFGRIDMDVFADEARADEQVRALTSRITVVPNAEFDVNWPEDRPVAMTVRLKDGRTIERALTRPRGSAGVPLDRDFIFEKFRALYHRGRPERDPRRAFDRVLALGEADGLSGVLESFA